MLILYRPRYTLEQLHFPDNDAFMQRSRELCPWCIAAMSPEPTPNPLKRAETPTMLRIKGPFHADWMTSVRYAFVAPLGET